MTRSVYVTGIGRGDGRQVVELGVMELLTRQVDRVGVFRPLVHDGPDRIFELLRARYRLAQDPAPVYGMGYDEAAALQAEQGTDELVARLVDRFHAGRRGVRRVLVLGTDFAGTQLPDELALNARLANEFGASVLPVVGGQGPERGVRGRRGRATPTARTAALGCDVLAMVVNRVAPPRGRRGRSGSTPQLPVPVYVLPDEPALSAPTVAQIVARARRRGAARRRRGAGPGRAGLRLRRRDAAELPARADPGLPGGDPGRPGRPGGRHRSPRTRRARRRSPACC